MKVLAFLLGMCTAYLWPYLPSWWTLAGLLTIAVLVIIGMRRFYGLAFLLLGIVWIWFAILMLAKPLLPVHMQQRTITVTGIVASLVTQFDRGQRFVFTTKTIDGKKQTLQLRLSWYQLEKKVSPGQWWRLQVRLKRPHNAGNAGGFNIERWMFVNQYSASGYIKGDDNHLLKKAGYHFLITQWRSRLQQSIMKSLHGSGLTNIVLALAIGDKTTVTTDQKQMLQITGTSHLLAISGLHVGFAAAVFYLLVIFLWRLFPRLCLLIAAPRVAALAAMIAAIFYSALAGFSLPTVRALIMLLVFMGCLFSMRPLRPWRALTIALWLILLLQPLSVLSASFWLSFGAVFIIASSLSGRKTKVRRWQKIVRLQLCVSLGMLPLTLLYFQQASIVSPLANVIAIPWVGFIIVPLILCACIMLVINTTIAHGLFWLAVKNLHYLFLLLQYFSNLPEASLQLAVPNFLVLLLLVVAILLLLAPKGFPAKYLSLFLILPLIFPEQASIPKSEARINVLDVGQGLAVLIQTQHHSLLYDTGPRYSDENNAGSAIVLPFLHKQSLHKLNVLMLSHIDSDHSGGFDAIVKALPINKIYTSADALLLSKKAQPCRRGQSWQWDGINFKVLYPDATVKGSTNNRSCVLKVSAGEHSLLLPGDIEKEAERQLVRQQYPQLRATVLIAPHHGSLTSSSWSFLRAVAPQFVIFTTGYLNRFHFPNAIVRKRYHALRVKTLDTAISGAVHFLLTNAGVKSLHCYYHCTII